MTADILIGSVVGVVAGLVFFGGLRWTVARLVTARRPLVLATASFLVRSGVVVVGLVILVQGELARILGALAGMLVARTALVSFARREIAHWEEAT